MVVRTLKLVDWRNFACESFSFAPGLNLIVGENGAGKTNLLEAVSYLSFARSFRKSPDRDLVRNGASKASLEGVFQRDDEKYSLKVEALLNASGKQIRVDGKKVKTLSSFVGSVLTVVFQPQSVFLFKESPSERRRLLDETLSSVDGKYLYSLQRYRKVLRERNQALTTSFDEEVMAVLTRELIRCSYPVVARRLALVEELQRLADPFFAKLYGEGEKLRFAYRTNTPATESAQGYADKMAELYERRKSYERIHRLTLVGPHRDDLAAYLSDKPLGSYGSQGQNRLASLAVTLSLAKLVKEKRGEDPILVLDDALSDLDEEKQEKLLETAKDFEQVLLSGSKIRWEGRGFPTLRIEKGRDDASDHPGGNENV